MEQQPFVSIIILNYNGKQFLESCLTSVINADYPDFEIIFVDNGSTDGSVELVKEKFCDNPRLRIVRNKENLGFAEGNNVGAKHATGDYIVFLNNDTKVDPYWLKELVKVVESDQTIGAAQSKLLFADDREKIWAVGEFINYFGDDITKGQGEKDIGQYDRVEEIFNAIGASMIVRRKIFTELGMFDPAFFIQHEDVDLGWRIWLRGYRVVFAPKSVVYHVGGATLQKEFPGTFKTFFDKKNCIAMMMKNYRFKNLVKFVSARIIIDISMAIRLTFMHKNDVAIAIIRAVFWNLIHFQHIWKRRLEVQRTLRKVSDEYLMKRVMKPPPIPSIFVLLNSFPFGRRLLKHYKHG